MNKEINLLILMSTLTTPSIAQQPCDAFCQNFIQKCKDATDDLNTFFSNSSNWKACFPNDPTSDIICAWGNVSTLSLQPSELYLQNNKRPPHKEDYNPQLTYSYAYGSKRCVSVLL
ncbi:MAG: hypothetical protein JSR85_00175 [Proteobacteria bacterium]|nr:hypothetical protein [Pseudomonadota bacterium]